MISPNTICTFLDAVFHCFVFFQGHWPQLATLLRTIFKPLPRNICCFCLWGQNAKLMPAFCICVCTSRYVLTINLYCKDWHTFILPIHPFFGNCSLKIKLIDGCKQIKCFLLEIFTAWEIIKNFQWMGNYCLRLCGCVAGNMVGIEERTDSTKYQQSLNANVMQPVKKGRLKKPTMSSTTRQCKANLKHHWKYEGIKCCAYTARTWSDLE